VSFLGPLSGVQEGARRNWERLVFLAEQGGEDQGNKRKGTRGTKKGCVEEGRIERDP